MHRLKYKIKKGYVMIYVMFISMLMITMMLTVFKFEIEKHKTLQYRKHNMEKADNYSYKREKVFSMLYEVLKNKGIQINKQAIINAVRNNPTEYNVSHENVDINYLDRKELFQISFRYGEYPRRYEYYDIFIENNCIEFKMIYMEKR